MTYETYFGTFYITNFFVQGNQHTIN